MKHSNVWKPIRGGGEGGGEPQYFLGDKKRQTFSKLMPGSLSRETAGATAAGIKISGSEAGASSSEMGEMEAAESGVAAAGAGVVTIGMAAGSLSSTMGTSVGAVFWAVAAAALMRLLVLIDGVLLSTAAGVAGATTVERGGPCPLVGGGL